MPRAGEDASEHATRSHHGKLLTNLTPRCGKVRCPIFSPDAAIRRARAAVMLGDLGLSAPQGLYQKDTASRSGKAQGPMIAADGVRPIAAFGFSLPAHVPSTLTR